MAFSVPTTEPSSLVAGITWQWEKTVSDYPPSEGWTLTYYLTGKTSLSFAAEADPTDTVYSVSVPASETAAVEPGVYVWQARVSDGAGIIRLADAGRFDVTRDVASVAENEDARSHNEKMLARIEAEIEARLTGDGSGHDSYSIGGRSLSKYTMDGLHSLRSRYAFAVARDRNGGKVPPYAAVFNRAS